MKRIFIGFGFVLFALFIASICSDLQKSPDERCDFCHSWMLQVDEIEMATRSLTYFKCPNCEQLGERSVDKASKSTAWVEW